MSMMLSIAVLAFISVLGALVASRWERRGKYPGLFFDFLKHAAGNFRLVPLLLLTLSAALTWGLIALGWDRNIQIFFQKVNPLGETIPWVFIAGGSIWHMVLGALIYFYGRWKNRIKVRGAGLAGIQAVLVNGLINTSQKLLTGRRGPENLVDEVFRPHAYFPKSRNPADFAFDFWNRGHRDGRFFWPSGHTSAIFAFVAALRTYYPEKRWIPWVGYPFALLTAMAMVDGDFHWASDVVAGAILGEVLGGIVGRDFRRRYRDPQAASSA